MPYTPATIAKAAFAGVAAVIAAATAAAHGTDFSSLGIGEWLTVIGTGAIATGSTFLKPSKADKGDAPEAPSVVDQVIAGLPVVADSVTKAQEDLQKVQKAAEDAFGAIPVFGPLAKQSLDQILKGRG